VVLKVSARPVGVVLDRGALDSEMPHDPRALALYLAFTFKMIIWRPKTILIVGRFRRECIIGFRLSWRVLTSTEG
jgi:hypothetical protein